MCQRMCLQGDHYDKGMVIEYPTSPTSPVVLLVELKRSQEAYFNSVFAENELLSPLQCKDMLEYLLNESGRKKM